MQSFILTVTFLSCELDVSQHPEYKNILIARILIVSALVTVDVSITSIHHTLFNMPHMTRILHIGCSSS
jgi:hypothetical protein